MPAVFIIDCLIIWCYKRYSHLQMTGMMAKKREPVPPPIQPMPEGSDEVTFVPVKYQHESIRGCRLPGWEDLNVAHLAGEVGVTAQHMREVLTARNGVGLGLLMITARHLQLSIDGLLARIENARRLDARRKTRRDTRFG